MVYSPSRRRHGGEAIETACDLRMPRAESLLADAAGALVERSCLLVLGLCAADLGEVVQGVGHCGVVGPEDPFLDGQSPAAQGLTVGIAVAGELRAREVLQAEHDVGVVRRQGLLPDGQRSLVERLGGEISPPGIVEDTEITENGGHLPVFGPKGRFGALQGLLGYAHGLFIISVFVEGRDLGRQSAPFVGWGVGVHRWETV